MRSSLGSILSVLILASLVSLFGCSPEVGSRDWCDDMKKKAKKDWTAEEAANYAKHCIIRVE